MKVNQDKAFEAQKDRLNIPRKSKKWLMGKKLSKAKLKRLIKTVCIVETFKTMYERPVISPYAFCPECGCFSYYGTGNMSSYPEHYELFNCMRCDSVVAYIDNSPFVHVLQEINIPCQNQK